MTGAPGHGRAGQEKAGQDKRLSLARSAPWLGFALLCLVIALPWHKPRPHVQPTGYVNIVNQLILNGKLVARGRGPDLHVSKACDPCRASDISLPERWLALNFSPGRRFDFATQSFLDEDLNNPAVWRPDRTGNLQSYIVQARQISGPVSNVHDWPWNVRYDPTQSGPDTSQVAVILLAASAQVPLAAGGRVALPESGGALVLDSNRNLAFAACGNLDIVEVDGGRSYTIPCGRTLRPGSYEGRTYVVSRHDNSNSYLRRQPPDLITLVRLGAVISQPAGGARVRDPILAGEASDNFVTALEGGFYRGRGCGDGNSHDLCTTLRRSVQQASQSLLSRTAGALRDSAPSSFRAGAVFMDGRTGAIVAVPTYPLSHADLKPAEANYPWLQPWLAENTNFVRLPIGSTAKIPFALAILQKWPGLRQLRVDNGADRIDRILGVDHEISDDAPEIGVNPMDFAHFIPLSSNKYARTLMVLGLANDTTNYSQPLKSGRKPGLDHGQRAWDGYVLGGQRSLVAPRWPAESEGFAAAWRNNLWTYFCVEPTHLDKRATNGTKNCRNPDDLASTWFAGGDFERFAALAPLYFTPPELGYEDHGRGDIDSYLMTALGGADSQWSTVHLAQTYSRIFTNCPVTAQLIRNGRNPELCSQDLGLNGENLAAVRAGMSLTIPTGTAKHLIDGRAAFLAATGHSDDYVIYAKTGTPNPPVRNYFAGLRTAIQDENCLVTKNATTSRLQVGDAKGKTCGRSVRRAAQADIRRFNARRGMAAYAETATGEDRVVRLAREAQFEETASTGKALVLVIEHLDAGRPCTLSTIAINFQYHTGSGWGPALLYGEGLLNDTTVRQWLTRPCNS